MKKALRLCLLVAILASASGMWYYTTRPLTFDGSSEENFQVSLKLIQDSLEEHEQLQFQRDMNSVEMLLTAEDPELLGAMALARFQPDGAATIKAKLADAERKRLDGKTLEDFRQLAGQGRAKGQESFGVSSDGEFYNAPRTTSPKQAKPRESPMWASIDELLAAGPKTEVVTHEIHADGIDYLIDAPEDATIIGPYVGISFRLLLASGEEAYIRPGSWDIPHIRRMNYRMIYEGQDTIVFSDDSVFIEKMHTRKRQDKHPYAAKLNIMAGKWRELHATIQTQNESTFSTDESVRLEPALLLIRCARTLRLAEPDPEDPVDLLDALGITYAPDSAFEADEIRELQFAGDATTAQFRVVELFPDLQAVVIPGGDLSDTDRDELAPLRDRPGLKKFKLEAYLRESSLETVFSQSALEELDLKITTGNADATWFRRFTELKELRHLTLEVTGKHATYLNALVSCRKLERLHIKLQGYEIEDVTGGFEFLQDLPALRELSMEGSFDSKALLKSIGTMPALESLRLSLSTTDGVTLKHLAEIQTLKTVSLNLKYSTIAFDDFASLAGGTIERLKIRSWESSDDEPAAVTDETLTSLAQVTSLQEIELESPTVTVEGLTALTENQNLKAMILHESDALTSDDIDSFREAHPNLEITTER